MAAIDTFSGYVGGSGASPERAINVTKSDENDLPYVTRAIYVGVAGDVTLLTKGGDTTTWPAVPAGTTIIIRATKILASGTTASGFVISW